MRVLVVEDEPEMCRLISDRVEQAGYVVDSVNSIDEADAAIAIARYALMLLDRRLPDGDGLALIRRLRAVQPGVPVIVLTALDGVPDRIRGLDAGADDYVVKPFDAEELLARVRAALRRPGVDLQPPVRCGAISFELTSREVWIGGRPVILKRRELSLLGALISRSGRVVQRETLLNEVYGFEDIQSNTLEAHVSRLRARLTEERAEVSIHPVRGVGYMLDASVVRN